MLDFTQYTKPDYQADKFHKTLCHYLDLWIDKKIKRLMVFAPPQHGKSEIVSRRCSAYLLGKRPQARIIGTSYSSDLASRMNLDVQRIVDSDEYRALFPLTRLGGASSRNRGRVPYLRNSEEFEVAGNRGSYRSAGRGQGVTGRPADYIVIDDPIKSDEEASSPAVRDSIWEWYTGSLYTRLASDGCILLTQTRWHRDDLAGRLEALITGADAAAADMGLDSEPWVILRFQAIAPAEPPSYDQREPGEALAPSRFGIKALTDRRYTLGPTKWQAMYEQNPRPQGNTEFAGEWFDDSMWFERWPLGLTVKTMALDPSKGKSDRKGDYSAYALLGRDSQDTLYCQCNMSRRPIPQMIADGVGLYKQFQPDGFGIESNQFQSLLGPEFSSEFERQGVLAPNPFLIDNRVNKLVRIRRLSGYLSTGRIKFLAGCPGTKLLVDQLMDFPSGDHDDGPDALEMALRLMTELVNGAGGEEGIPETVYAE